MKLGSLFDGSGGFPLAGLRHGIEPVWASEIEAFPIAVTTKRFPNMKHLGDITKINGAEIEPVDIITGGSPCQDLSLAGKRAGLSGERSNLFMEQVRVTKEMRNKTNGKYPTFMVWENVMGAFSSNKGEDFRTVLEEICKIADPDISIPRPPKDKWSKSGVIMGDTYSIAWRSMDAQFWGVPQRRRRIFLVADFGGHRAREILFECQSLHGDTAESGETRQGTTADTERGVDGTSDVICVATQQGNAEIMVDKCPTITQAAGTSGNNQPYICEKQQTTNYLNGWDCQRYRIATTDSVCPTLDAGEGGGGHGVNILEKQYAVDFGRTADRIQINANKSVTLQGEGGGCGAKTGLYLLPSYSVELGAASRGQGNRVWKEQSNTLRADMGDNQTSVIVPIVLNDQGGSCISVEKEDISPTLRSEAHGNLPCVVENTAYSFDSLSSNSMKSKNPHSGCREVSIAKTIDTTTQDPSKNQGGIAILNKSAGFVGGMGAKAHGIGFEEEKSPTLQAGRDSHVVCQQKPVVFNGETITSKTNASNPKPGDPCHTLGASGAGRAYCLQGNGIDRADTAGCNGKGWKEDVAYTLNTIDRHAVCNASKEDIYGMTVGSWGTWEKEKAQTLTARDYKDPQIVNTPYKVRRLTPTECLRLMGLPDWWCDDVEGRSDTKVYKLCGNGVVINCVEFILGNIAKILKGEIQ